MRHPILALLLVLITEAHAQQWNWAVDAGGSGNTDFCFGIATDSQGNVYWCGSVSGTADFGCATIAPGNNVVGVLAKYDASGNCQWVRSMGTTFDYSWTYNVAIDAQDRIYVTGSYNGNATFGSGVTLASMGSDDIFLARYNVLGDCLWAHRAGSSGSSDEARGIALSDDGGIFICGFSGGTTISFDGISIPNPTNYRQIVVARYDSTGAVQWAETSTGNGQGKNARAICVVGDRLFVTGQVGFNTTAFDGLALSPTANGTYLFVLACDLDGNALWARSYGNGDHEGYGIAADTLGNLFVTGRMWGTLYLPDDTLTSVSSNDD
ncbi:MAG TPA: SBBP repeat-containing protein, partial [Flavobacteriales bacterium]|nr:SBBP repeat-containing protein [Flavobacteriales bacterium]